MTRGLHPFSPLKNDLYVRNRSHHWENGKRFICHLDALGEVESEDWVIGDDLIDCFVQGVIRSPTCVNEKDYYLVDEAVYENTAKKSMHQFRHGPTNRIANNSEDDDFAEWFRGLELTEID